MTSAQLIQTLRSELGSYPNHKDKLANLDRLETICNAIENGSAIEKILAKFGRKAKFTGKINTNSVELTRRAFGLKGPGRSTVYRMPKLREYIELREMERLEKLPPLKNGHLNPELHFSIIRKLASFEDQTVLINALDKGEKSAKELRKLKAELKKIPGLSIHIDTLAGERPEETNHGSILQGSLPQSEQIETLRKLFLRLQNTEFLSRFELELENDCIKDVHVGQHLITPRELKAFRTIVETPTEE